jgi:hypothetical protein
VHALVVAAAGEDAAGVLVDDEDLAVERLNSSLALMALFRKPISGVLADSYRLWMPR